jgi:sugar (pentulose or hexulose) kinase
MSLQSPLASGVVKPGDACSILGTTICNETVLAEKAINEPFLSGGALSHVSEGNVLRFMATSAVTSALDWGRQEILGNEPYEQIEAWLMRSRLASERLFFHPYLFGGAGTLQQPLCQWWLFWHHSPSYPRAPGRAATKGSSFHAGLL